MAKTFLAEDNSIAVDLDDRALAAMLALCAKSGRLETGGVLIGRYSEFGDRVLVIKATGPTRDSRRFPFAFIRGIVGLTSRLRDEWKDGLYYVGEWHFHPFASPRPSGTDSKQIKAFARTSDLRCPHPTLLVLGGNPAGRWTMAAAVVSGGKLVPLLEKIPLEMNQDGGQASA